MFAEHLDVDHRLIDMPKLNSAQQTLDSVDDLQSSAVAEGKDKGEPVVAGGLLDRFMQLLLAPRR
jgi:hypothetical protein